LQHFRRASFRDRSGQHEHHDGRPASFETEPLHDVVPFEFIPKTPLIPSSDRTSVG
jgi:hypothetical protein